MKKASVFCCFGSMNVFAWFIEIGNPLSDCTLIQSSPSAHNVGCCMVKLTRNKKGISEDYQVRIAPSERIAISVSGTVVCRAVYSSLLPNPTKNLLTSFSFTFQSITAKGLNQWLIRWCYLLLFSNGQCGQYWGGLISKMDITAFTFGRTTTSFLIILCSSRSTEKARNKIYFLARRTKPCNLIFFYFIVPYSNLSF